MKQLKQLHELINREDPGWPIVQEWIVAATNPVEVLPPPDEATREQTLVSAQVTTRSPMGAVIYETGGLLVDNGWLRILGSGHPRLPRSFSKWNFGRSFSVSTERPQFLLVADDVIGGFFAIDGGGLSLETGKVCYFAPERLIWENTKLGYSQFLVWCFQGDLAKYYESERWPGWQEDLRGLTGDQAFSFEPPLSADRNPITERSRTITNIAGIYDQQIGHRN
jgi:hypothetical protein